MYTNHSPVNLRQQLFFNRVLFVRFTRALLLGLAYACNFGGMMTPISSLQNVLAVYYLEQVCIRYI
jgi:di/tricarboxylate transporter